MHLHTLGSDGIGTPEQIAENALKAGLDGFVITDHHHTYTAESLEVARVARSHGLMVFHGCEYSTSMGHLLIYGVDVEHFGFGYYPDTQYVINAVNAAGGRCIPAHPYKGYKRFYGDDIQCLSGLAGIEVANGQCTFQNPRANAKAKVTALAMEVPGVGGSDAHNPRHIGLTYTRFNRPVQTYLDFIEALDAQDFTAMISRSRVDAELARRRKSARQRRACEAVNVNYDALPPWAKVNWQ